MSSNIRILMSAHNAADTIKEAVDSILSQSCKSFDLVVYDDASTDGTADILKRYDDPRLTVRTLSENRGLTRNLYEAVAEIGGDFIARMDADDIAMPERLAEQVAYMEAHPEIDVLGTNVIFFDELGTETLGRQPENHDDIALALFFGFTMMHPTVIMRTAALRSGGWNYDPHFRYSQDFDLWSRMIPRHRFANLQKPLLKLREHPRKISRANRVEQQQFTNEIRERQIRQVLPDATAGEVSALAAAARGDLSTDRAEVEALEACLLRLIDGNAVRQVYPEPGFTRAAATMFRESCRRMLKQGRAQGRCYLRSRLRSHAPAQSLRQRTGFLLLCVLAVLGISVTR